MSLNKKEYMKEYNKAYREVNREKIKASKKEYNKRPEVKARMKEYNKRYQQENKDKIGEQRKKYYLENIKKCKEWGKKYRQENKGYCKEYNVSYYKKNKDNIKEYAKKYLQENKEKMSGARKKWRENNRDTFNKMGREYIKKRRGKDLNFRTKIYLRARLWIALNKYSKTGKIKPSCSYGIDYKAIIEHLKPFPENIKEYQIDHIIPLSRFDFNNPKHIKIAFVPSNHQWLTKEQNMEKGNKLIMPHVYNNLGRRK